MIGPNMATMLGLVLTDAPLHAGRRAAALSTVVDETFNCISVEGHMSTNDTVLLLANGAAGGPPLAGADVGAVPRRRCSRSAPSWRERFPPTAKGPRT